ncbi:MAG: leucine-rich repeat protein [Eubacteriales bacterium]|nr:leucine-rich repeat protein [Eubacteriales bacterium]
MEVLWEKTENGMKVHRVFGEQMFLKLPESIEGFPVTEIGPYCFSSSEKYSLKEGILTSLEEKEEVGISERRILEAKLPEIAGKYLEGAILPDSVVKLSNGAFYNCRNIKSLSIGTKLHNLGNDVFTNCGKLSSIIIRGNVEEKTVLPLILERMQTELEVFFQPNENEIECRLFFPEIYEEFDEMVTAHVFNRMIVGEGFRMRQCFHDHRIHFAKYDQCFAGSLKLEGNREICCIAMNRLRWPLDLKEEYESIYRKAIEERFDYMIKMIIGKRDLEELKFLCKYFKPKEEILANWMESCINADWTEGNVFLMGEKYKGESFASKTFDFDDLDF